MERCPEQVEDLGVFQSAMSPIYPPASGGRKCPKREQGDGVMGSTPHAIPAELGADQNLNRN